MEKQLVKKEKNEIMARESQDVPSFPMNFFPLPFISFSYSRTSIHSDGETTHIEAEEHQFEKGRLDSRHFEGTLAGDYVQQVTRMIEQQMNLFVNAMNVFLPFNKK